MKKLLVSVLLITACQGKQGVQGDRGYQGVPGEAGPIGNTGPVGNTGPAGTPGSNGQNGSPGTVVAPIQFCPGFQPAYPNTFPELGFCIDNKLYGVYSANDGFMVYMPPGSYYSDGINASCTFTVLDDCVIQ